MEWYRFDTVEAAQACLDAVNNHPKLPHVGRNALSGKLQPDKCQTTKWCDSVTECLDGKFGFPRVTEKWLDILEVSEEDRQAFLDAFNPSIEEYDPAWIPAREEEIV
jgi:hypothetical protein